MYFVTVGRKGYVLFTMTPSERAAVGLTEGNEVQLLSRQGTADWEILARWNGKDFSHTDFMLALHERDEPAEPRELLDILPPGVRS